MCTADPSALTRNGTYNHPCAHTLSNEPSEYKPSYTDSEPHATTHKHIHTLTHITLTHTQISSHSHNNTSTLPTKHFKLEIIPIYALFDN